MRGVGARRGHLRRSMTGCGDDGGATTTSTSTCRSRPTRRRRWASITTVPAIACSTAGAGGNIYTAYGKTYWTATVGHDADTGLGAWTATRGCEVGEGGTLELHAAMR